MLKCRSNSLTNKLFTSAYPDQLLLAVAKNFYLYVPLLTMGLVSREFQSGSIKLLLSSPVKIKEIVLGKYIAMMTYGIIFIAILCLYILAGYYSIKSLDLGLLASGLIGIYLLFCAYAAIGLFMSCLTSYQVVAAFD